MPPELSSRTHAGRTGDIAFAVAVLAGYAATLTSSERFTLREALLLILLGVAYLSIGIYGFAWCERLSRRFAYAAYFAAQIPLGATLLYLSRARAGCASCPWLARASPCHAGGRCSSVPWSWRPVYYPLA